MSYIARNSHSSASDARQARITLPPAPWDPPQPVATAEPEEAPWYVRLAGEIEPLLAQPRTTTEIVELLGGSTRGVQDALKWMRQHGRAKVIGKTDLKRGGKVNVWGRP